METHQSLRSKADWIRRQTLALHKAAPETRLASSLSCVEILVALHYHLLRIDPADPLSDKRDRLIVSKGHGTISLYPILADRGFIPAWELERPFLSGSLLKVIPDTFIPGYETTNGSLGHGLGVGVGVALGLRAKGSDRLSVVLCGDGEFNEGSMWEAIMFAGHHHLDNLTLIVDLNKLSMLDYCDNIIKLSPLSDKLSVFGWKVWEVRDGHDFDQLMPPLAEALAGGHGQPTAIIVSTVKGKGVPRLERDSLCHIRSLAADEVDRLLGGDNHDAD